ncbi:hypothetical protein [Streptomyces griseus]|uniref:hypothetical protein n=1 Tax=Streptomyces griseus TaxID=1911 RepID=UPI0033C2E13C
MSLIPEDQLRAMPRRASETFRLRFFDPDTTLTGVEKHTFEQDPAEEATLCKECGMWPEYHSHSRPEDRWGRGCICADCIPNADHLPG